MTAKTSQKLADALRAAGFEDLAVRAEADEFHDYLSPHAMPTLRLIGELDGIGTKGREAADRIRMQVIDGDFDADEEEALE